MLKKKKIKGCKKIACLFKEKKIKFSGYLQKIKGFFFYLQPENLITIAFYLWGADQKVSLAE